MRKWRYILPILGFVIIGGVVFVLFFMMTPTGCGCMPDPSLNLDQKQAEYYIAAEIPTEARDVQYSGYGVDYAEDKRRYTTSEVYVSFAASPAVIDDFLASLPNLAPMQPNHNPFDGHNPYISNFGTRNGTPEIFEGSTYRFPLCDRAVMVDKSNPAQHHIFIFASCEGN